MAEGMVKRYDRYFHLGMAILMTAIVLYGFGPGLDRRLLHPVRPKPVLLTLHSLVNGAWVLLFLIQAILARLRKIRLHRTLGLLGCGLGALLPVLGLATAVVMKRWHMAEDGEASAADLGIPLNDMLTFAIAFALAIRWRKQPERHRRLMLIAFASLTVAAFARFPDHLVPDLAFYGGVDLLILLAMARDLLVTARVHEVYRFGLPALLCGQAAAMALMLAPPGWWESATLAAVGVKGRWVASWSAVPQPSAPGDVEDFQGKTIRLIAHVSLGGSQVRITLSNRYGSAPLTIGKASAASVPLTFAGREAVIIPAGGEVRSDAAALPIAALSDLPVTLYFPGAAPATTSHALALQTGYVLREDLSPDHTLDECPFLSEVDVLAPLGASTLVGFGDSLIDGDGSTADSNHRLGDFLAARTVGRRMAVVNQGLIGNRLLHDSPEASREKFGALFGEAGLRRFDRDVLSVPGVSAVILRFGTNDLGFPGSFAGAEEPVTAQQLIDGLRELATRAHKAKLKVIFTTLPPFEGARVPGYFSAEKEMVRLAVNDWIRRSGDFDSVADFDALLRDPGHPGRLWGQFSSEDQLHPNDAGYEMLAAAFPIPNL